MLSILEWKFKILTTTTTNFREAENVEEVGLTKCWLSVWRHKGFICFSMWVCACGCMCVHLKFFMIKCPQRFCCIPRTHIKLRHFRGWWPVVFKVMCSGGHFLDIHAFTSLSMWPLFVSLPGTEYFKPFPSSFSPSRFPYFKRHAPSRHWALSGHRGDLLLLWVAK